MSLCTFVVKLYAKSSYKTHPGSSGRVPVTPIGGNRMYLIRSMGIACIFEAVRSFKLDTEKRR